MTYSLDPPIAVGGIAIAVVSRTEVSARQCCGYAAVTCSKRPEYVLMRVGLRITVSDMSGQSVTQDTINRLCPDAIARLSAFADTEPT